MDVEKILRKRKWTGKELGQLVIANMCYMFKQAFEAPEDDFSFKPTPLVSRSKLEDMVNELTEGQYKDYNGYLAIQSWITTKWNVARTQRMSLIDTFNTLNNYITDSMIAENLQIYKAQLPKIMTQKQYDEFTKKNMEDFLLGEDGTGEIGDTIPQMLEEVFKMYAKLLEEEPKKKNPLKAIKDKYSKEQIKSELIINKYAEVNGLGYFQLITGERSDKLSEEEWIQAVSQDKVQKAIRNSEARDRYTKELLPPLLASFLVQSLADPIFSKGNNTEDEWEAPVTWHYSEEKPSLNKWDFLIEATTNTDLGYYFPTLFSIKDAEKEALKEETEAFCSEFRELIDAFIADVDSKYPDAFGQPAKDIPEEEWREWYTPWKDRYKMNMYGFKDRADTDSYNTLRTDRRAYANGVAIIQPTDTIRENIDENGYYVEPEEILSYDLLTIDALFTDAPNYAFTADTIEQCYHSISNYQYQLLGYNTALDLIMGAYDVPELEVFRVDEVKAITKVTNASLAKLYEQILNTYRITGDKRQQKKLEIMRDYFPEIIPPDKIDPARFEKAKELLDNYKAFYDSNDTFFYLMVSKPRAEGDTEGVYEW